MNDFTHLDQAGRAKMVDVSAKNPTPRIAVATGSIRMSPTTLDAIRSNSLGKGDVLAVARIAGIMAAKKTSELIPLCHQIALADVTIEFDIDAALPGVRAEARAKTLDRTGVEIEALTAVSIALLTIYDMAKALDRGMTITQVALLEKSGGKSGDWRRGES